MKFRMCYKNSYIFDMPLKLDKKNCFRSFAFLRPYNSCINQNQFGDEQETQQRNFNITCEFVSTEGTMCIHTAHIIISLTKFTSMNIEHTLKSNKGKQRADLQINVLNEKKEK